MNEHAHILIVDRDAVAARALEQMLVGRGYACGVVASADEAIRHLERERASASGSATGVVIADQECGGVGGGLGLIRRLHDAWPGVVPIMVSAFRKVESAVQTMRLGAADYLLKPVVAEELFDAVERAEQHHLLIAGQGPGPDVLPADEQHPETHGNVEAHPPSDTEEPADGDGWTPMPLTEAMKAPERRILLAALEANGWNRGETARQLDINRTTLYKKIRQHRLDEPA